MKKIISKTIISTTCLSCISFIPLTAIVDKQVINTQMNTKGLNKLMNKQSYDITMDVTTREDMTCGVYKTFYYKPNIEKEIKVNISPIFYNELNQLYKEFFRQAVDGHSVSGITRIHYGSYTAWGKYYYFLEAYTKARVNSLCKFRVPTYPDPGVHEHYNYSFDFTKPDNYLTKDVFATLTSIRPLMDGGIYIGDVLNKNDIFIKVDEDSTIQGFKHNYLGLKLDSNYLKSLMLSAINLNAIQNILNDDKYASINKNDNFKIAIEYLRQGKLFDSSHSLTSKIVPSNELSNTSKDIRTWLDKIILNQNIEGIDKKDNWLSYYKYINEYNINVVDDKICFLYDQLLFDKKLSLEINWSSNTVNKTIQLDFNYDSINKIFVFTQSNSDLYQLKINEVNYDHNEVSITQIKLFDMTYGYNFLLCGVNMLNQNNELIELNLDKYTHIYKFEIDKLIDIKQNLKKQYWIDLFKPFAIDGEDLVNNPEEFDDNLKFQDLVTSFSTNESPLKVIDDDLYAYLAKDTNLSLSNNIYIKKLVHDYKINTYNSVNGVELSINYYDYNSAGIKQSNKLINKIVRYSLSDDQIHEPTHTEVIKNKIITKDKLFDPPEKFILDKFIGYKNDKDNKLITTKLSKQDWIENSLNSIQINENNKFHIKGVINYSENSSMLNFLEYQKNQTTNSLNFEIIFHDNIPNTGNNPTEGHEPNNEENAFWKSTILWVAIGSISAVVLIFSLSYFYVSRNKKIKLDNAKKIALDPIEEKL